MTKEIRVIWPDESGKIEYFRGIDVDNLDGIPPLVSVPDHLAPIPRRHRCRVPHR